jgi:hypothetical protein
VTRTALAFLLATLGAALASGPAFGQTIGGDVKQHADRELEHKRKPPAAKPPHRHREHRHGSTATTPAAGPETPEEPEEVPGPKLPQRVIGKFLQIDPQLGAGYRGWVPQPYPRVAVSSQGYFTWAVQLRGKLFRWVTLQRAYYESNALAAPRVSDEASVATKVGSYAPQAAWLMGAIGFPLNLLIEPMIRYETRVHRTTAEAKSAPGVRIIPFSASKNDDPALYPQTTEPLVLTAGFETFVVAGKYNPKHGGLMGDSWGKIPPFYVGAGFIRYNKPYQFNVGDAVLDDYIFSARFRGGGLALGIASGEKPDRFFVDFAGIVGLGEVRLLHDLTLNETVAGDTLIGFAQGNLTAGYVLPLLRTKPTLLLVLSASGGGATFFFFKTQYQQDEQIETPPLNWDFLWGGQAYLALPL